MSKKFELKVKIAGICFSIVSESPEVIQLLKKWYDGFLSSGKPVGRIEIEVNDIEAGHRGVNFFTKNEHVYALDRDFMGCINLREDWGKIIIKDARYSLVDIFPRVFYSMLALKYDGFLIHAAGMLKGDSGLLFTGPSGAGKTTVSGLSQERYQIVNDDIVAVRNIDGEFRLFGTPFWGTINIKRKNRSGRLKAIFVLKKDNRLHFKKMGGREALGALMSNILLFTTQLQMNEKILDLSLEVLKKTPIYKMHFLPEDSFLGWINEHIT